MAEASDNGYLFSLEDVRAMLHRPLPGRPAQMKMAPQIPPRYAERFANPPATPRLSAVLILLYPNRERLHFVLTRRSEHLANHRGQISLPGGAQDDHETLLQTALREANEELAVPAEKVQVVGRLSPFYVVPSNYCVHPFIGYVPFTPQFRPQTGEVAAILEVPLQALLVPANRRIEYWPDRELVELRRVPVFDFQNWMVWGATAMILNELVTLMEAYLAEAEPGSPAGNHPPRAAPGRNFPGERS